MKHHQRGPKARASFAVALTAALTAAACTGGGAGGASPGTTAAPPPTTAPSTTTTAAHEDPHLAEPNVGPGCATLSPEGPLPPDALAAAPAVTAAAGNPQLSTFAAAVGAAGQREALDGPGPFTIFVPRNDAFSRLDEATLGAFLADPAGQLGAVISHHVLVGQQLDVAALVESRLLQTQQGALVEVTARGGTIEVGAAELVCGNVRTANATVHVVDRVLLPG